VLRVTRSRWRSALCVFFGVAVIAGCASAKPKATQSPGLRGTAMSTFACPARPTIPAAKPVAIDGARALRLCPLDAPGLQPKTVTVTAYQPVFASLITALSVPDDPATRGACPAYADLPQTVLAQTSRCVYQVAIPVDGCMHYQRAALDALSRARG